MGHFESMQKRKPLTKVRRQLRQTHLALGIPGVGGDDRDEGTEFCSELQLLCIPSVIRLEL